MVTLVIDGMPFALRADYDPDELRERLPKAIFRNEVEVLYLADETTLLVNWRAIRTLQLRVSEPQAPGAHSGR